MKLKIPSFLKKKNKEVIKEKKTINILETDDTSSIILESQKTYKDFIAPEYVDFAENPRYGLLNDKHFIKNVYIGTLPNVAEFARLFYTMYEFGNIDVSVFIKPLDSETAKADLSKLRVVLESEKYTARGNENRAEDMEAKAAEARRLREEIRDGYNKLYEVSIIGTLYEEDLKDLENSIDVLKRALGEKDIGLKNAIYIQEEAFRSNKPLNNNRVNEYHIMDKRSLACTFPFTSNNINHENGVLLGFNMDTGLPIFYDNFSNKLDNYGIFVFAKSGSGKSTLIKMLSARSSTLTDIQNISIDAEGEYELVTNRLGGINIYIKADTSTVINPFDCRPEKEENNITGKVYEMFNRDSKINNVTNVLMALFKGELGNPYYDDLAKSIIKDCVRAEYDRLGIKHNDIESLYEYVEGGTLGEIKRKKEMPTLSSWYQQLEIQAQKNTISTKAVYYDYLLEIMKDYTKYQNGSFTCFDGQSTVEINYDIPFINFHIKELDEKKERPIAQYIITNFIWEQLVKRNVKTGHQMRLIVDEAWMMVRYPGAVEFLCDAARRGRKYNTSLTVITQQWQDFYSEETKPIVLNTDTKFFLKPDKSDIEGIRSTFQLTDGEVNFLKTITRGQCLMKANNIAAKLKIEIPDVELEFIETNQNIISEKQYKAGV